ncbi:hypothetical protein JCM8097_001214 [Rhodosporidiobolus ruineniae]
MSTLPQSAVDASTRLLRVLASVAAQLDPVKGIKATTLRGFAEDIEDIRKDQFDLFSFERRPGPYLDAVSAHETLSTALRLLASPPPPSTPSPFLRLPTELVARIVYFCQTDDLRLRQNTNLALSRTCRLFNRHASPILAREMRLYTPGQVERADAATDALCARRRKIRIQELTVDVKLDEIKRQPDGSWPGRRLKLLITWLLDRNCLSTLYLHVRTPADATATALAEPEQHATRVLNALGMDHREWWWQLPDVQDLHLPAVPSSRDEYSLFGPPDSLRRLRLGLSSPPYRCDPEKLRRAREYHDRLQARRAELDEEPLEARFEVFAAPYHTFFPDDLRALVVPTCRPVTLTRLDVVVRLVDIRQDAHDLASILHALSPTLCHLALRLRYRGLFESAIDKAVLPAVAACKRLEHFELGGADAGEGTMQAFVDCLDSLPLLRTLVLLPLSPIFHLYFPITYRKLPTTLHRLVVYPPDLLAHDSWATWTGGFTDRVMEFCEDNKIELTLKEDKAEWELYEHW